MPLNRDPIEIRLIREAVEAKTQAPDEATQASETSQQGFWLKAWLLVFATAILALTAAIVGHELKHLWGP